MAVNAGAGAGQRRSGLDTGGQIRRTPFRTSPCDVVALSVPEFTSELDLHGSGFRSAVESVAR